jgi:predicted transposase YdaD
LPVRSVVVLLRKEADGPAMSGVLRYEGMRFRYGVARLWEIPTEQVLSAPANLLPLAPLTEVSPEELTNVVRRMEARIDREVAREERATVWTTTFLLLGLKYDREFATQLLKGVRQMKESSTYQWILEQGIERGIEQGIERGIEQGIEAGRATEARQMLLLLGRKRLGEPDAPTLAALEALSDPNQLESLALRLFEVESWEELLN